jgi:phage-related protein
MPVVAAYDDLLADARKEAGFQLGKVHAGLEPTDWKPFDDMGAVQERFASRTRAASTV